MKSLFMTKDITGYILATENYRLLSPGVEQCYDEYEFRFYDTDTGNFIEKVKLRHHPGFVAAKGPYLCYVRRQSVRVIRITSEKAKIYKLSFPKEHFNETPGTSLDERQEFNFDYSLIDFLGKSNILVANMRTQSRTKPILFTLDLDAVTLAKTSEQLNKAFATPLGCNADIFPGSSMDFALWHKYEDWYQPVYKTNRVKGCVDLVGVTRKKLESDAAVVETHYFVTEMQCSEV